MADLVPCLDCGQLISPTANSCPKCKSTYPRGIHCLVCHAHWYSARSEPKYFPVSQALTKPDDVGNLLGYHPECVERVLKVPDNVACADCGVTINKLWDWKTLFNSKDWYGPCPECGRSVLMSVRRHRYCHDCELPILFWHKCITTDDWSSYHDFCLPERFHHLLDEKKTEREVVEANLSKGCLSLALLILILITLVLNSVRF